MKKALIVDDSSLWREFVSDIVKREGFEVETAEDGVEGYKKALEFCPDIIFSDVEMPGMRGYTLCRLLRNEEAFKNAGIIIMTSLDETLNRFWALKAGASGFIQKGNDAEKLAHDIKKFLKEDFYSLSDLIDPSKAYKFEEVNNILEASILRETIKSEIYSLYSYIADEEHVLWKISDLLFQILPIRILSIMALSPHEGILFVSTKGEKVDANKLKETMFSALSKPVFPIEWNILGDGFGGKNSPALTTYVFKDKTGEEVGVLGIDALSSNEDEEIISDVVSNLGELFKLTLSYTSAIRQARYDELTGLLNFRTLMEKLTEYFYISKRSNEPLTIAMIDIDHFKKVNDTYGHLTGNEVLKKLAQIMSSSFRKVDVIGRYGGEEFTVGMINTPLENAKIAAERFRERVEDYDWESIAEGLKVTVSIGLASTINMKKHRTVVEVIESADEALYKAKKGGRNRVVVAE